MCFGKPAQKYLRKIRCTFPVFRKTERRFFHELACSVKEFEKQQPSCTLEDLELHFGLPKEVTLTYLTNMDSRSYFSLIRNSFYLKVVTGTAIVMMLLLIGMQRAFILERNERFANLSQLPTTLTIIKDGNVYGPCEVPHDSSSSGISDITFIR